MWTVLLDAYSGPGAVFMYAITMLGAYALAVVGERTWWLALRWRLVADDVIAAVARDDLDGARSAAGDGPLGHVLAAGLAEADEERAWKAMGPAAIEAEEALFARVSTLGSVGNVATMLGLLGTVFGLILAFSALGEAGQGERYVRLSEGIATAMSTTAAGLLVGIFAIGAHAALDARARRHLAAIERVAARVASQRPR